MEVQARTTMGEALERGWNDWGLIERVLAKAFMADWATERPRSEWIRLAEALEGIEFNNLYCENIDKRVKKAFNRMVRAGYLYSSNIKGKRSYGINLTN